MKILLDENLPHGLRHLLVPHDVETVTYRGWSGTKNGDLLKLASENGFQVFMTMDNGIGFQQNHARIPLSVLIISAPSNDLEDLRPLVPTILEFLARSPERDVNRISSQTR